MSNNAISNEIDLDWLARNVHEWPENDIIEIATTEIPSKLAFDGVAFSLKPSGLISRHAVYVTKDQWLARRAELQNKPSWAHAPEWAVYMAQSPNGHWEFFAVKPRAEGWWRHPIGERSSANNASIRGTILGDWRDTLEKRPEEFKPFTSIEDNQGQDMTQQHDMKQDNGWFERGEQPPVGTVCEVLWNEGRMEYLRTKVFGVNEHGQPIHRFDEGPNKFEYQADPLVTILGTRVFRPIRTERDVLIEIIKKTDDTDDKIADAILAAGFSLRGK